MHNLVRRQMRRSRESASIVSFLTSNRGVKGLRGKANDLNYGSCCSLLLFCGILYYFKIMHTTDYIDSLSQFSIIWYIYHHIYTFH